MEAFWSLKEHPGASFYQDYFFLLHLLFHYVISFFYSSFVCNSNWGLCLYTVLIKCLLVFCWIFQVSWSVWLDRVTLSNMFIDLASKNQRRWLMTSNASNCPFTGCIHKWTFNYDFCSACECNNNRQEAHGGGTSFHQSCQHTENPWWDFDMRLIHHVLSDINCYFHNDRKKTTRDNTAIYHLTLVLRNWICDRWNKLAQPAYSGPRSEVNIWS